MLMFFLTSIVAATQDKGLLGATGAVCMAGLGLVKWLDGRVRHVEVDTAANTAMIEQIDKNVTWLRQQRENGHARD